MPGSAHPLAKPLLHAVPANRALTGDTLSLVDNFVAAGLPRRIASHFDTTDHGKAFRLLTALGISNGTPINWYLWSFYILASSASGSERTMASTTCAVLGCVRDIVSKQKPTLMPALFPEHKVTEPDPSGGIYQPWSAFAELVIRGEVCFSLPPTSGTHTYVGNKYFASSACNNGGQNTRHDHLLPCSAGHSIVMNLPPAKPDPFSLCYSVCPLTPNNWEDVFLDL